MELIATVAGHEVQLHARSLGLCAKSAGYLQRRLVRRRRTHRGHAVVLPSERQPEVQPVAQLNHRAAAVDGEVLRLLISGPANVDVRRRCRGSGYHGHERAGVLTDRQSLHDLARQHRLLSNVRDVHDWGRAAHGDGLRHRADLHFAVHSGSKAGGHLDTFSPQRDEARQRECDAVGARTKIDNPVPPLVVGCRRAHFFDERRTRDLHGHARQHAARNVSHHTQNTAARRILRQRSAWQQDATDDGENDCQVPCAHTRASCAVNDSTRLYFARTEGVGGENSTMWYRFHSIMLAANVGSGMLWLLQHTLETLGGT